MPDMNILQTLPMGVRFVVMLWVLIPLAWALWVSTLYLRARVRSYNYDGAVSYIGKMRYRGIYAIRCAETGADYVGSTKKNFHARWGQHISDLDKGTHVNARLQEDWNTYGADAFSFWVIEHCSSGVPDDAIDIREREILEDRQRRLPPMLNYNVAYSRVYEVPRAPEAPEPMEPRTFQPTPRRRLRRQRQSAAIIDDTTFSLEDLGLTPEEIKALGIED